MMAVARLLALAPGRSVLTLAVLLVGVVAARRTLAGFRRGEAIPWLTTALALVSRIGHGWISSKVVVAGGGSWFT